MREGTGPVAVLHADGDATGAEVMRALIAAVEAGDRIEVIERRAIDLVMAETA